jgi:hypothetical protein
MEAAGASVAAGASESTGPSVAAGASEAADASEAAGASIPGPGASREAASNSVPAADVPGPATGIRQVRPAERNRVFPHGREGANLVVGHSLTSDSPDSLALSGHVRTDLVGQSDLWDAPPQETGHPPEHPEGWKSPWLAGGLSALVPGSGQIYAGNWWKAAIFLAIEAVAITYAVSNNKKGDDQTAFYESFADEHWNTSRYAQWTETNMNPPRGPYLWDLGNGQVNWDELNRMERDIGGWYSHTLPPYQSQQYYELIGKYPQYAQGWDDANPNVPPDYESAKANLPPNYLYYSGERGKANEYYSKSQTGVIVIVVNHLLSAADAAWTASSYNKGLNAGVGLQAVPPGGESLAGPALKLSYGF